MCATLKVQFHSSLAVSLGYVFGSVVVFKGMIFRSEIRLFFCFLFLFLFWSGAVSKGYVLGKGPSKYPLVFGV